MSVSKVLLTESGPRESSTDEDVHPEAAASSGDAAPAAHEEADELEANGQSEAEDGSQAQLRPSVLRLEGEDVPVLHHALVRFSHAAGDDNELDLQVGTIVNVIEDQESPDWWLGERSGKVGYFPRSHVNILPPLNPVTSDNEVVYANTVVFRKHKGEKTPSQPTTGKPALRPMSHYAAANSARASFAEPHKEGSSEPGQAAAAAGGSLAEDGGEGEGGAVGEEGEEEEYEEIAEYDEEEVDNIYARALYGYAATTESELSFKEGDIIELFSCEESEDWWSGSVRKKEGWFPAQYVQIMLEPPSADELQR